MMCLKGSIEGLPIDVFIDCGAAMNFLNPAIIQKLNHVIDTTTPFHFTTALGQTLTPYGQAHNIAVSPFKTISSLTPSSYSLWQAVTWFLELNG